VQQHQREIVLQQVEGACHAAQRHLEGACAQRGARHQREAAAAQSAREKAQRLVVHALHQQREEGHVLLGGDPGGGFVEQRGGDARVLQRLVDVHQRLARTRTDAREHAEDEGDRNGDGRLEHVSVD